MTNAVYFLDSSALVKHYAAETGTAWVESLINPQAENTIAIAQITVAEVAAALGSKLRGQFITADEFETAVRNILRDASETFTVVEINQQVIQRAVTVVKSHSLRGYDAVQLACGLLLNDILLAAGEQPLFFVTADQTLLAAAQTEGLLVQDPNKHLQSE